MLLNVSDDQPLHCKFSESCWVNWFGLFVVIYPFTGTVQYSLFSVYT